MEICFAHEYSLDFEEPFALVTSLTTFSSLVTVVKNAFLKDDLAQEVYAQPPLSYTHPLTKACQLCRALGGLNHATQAWFAKFSRTIAQLGFTSKSYNSVLFIHHNEINIILLLFYVNDMIITNNVKHGIHLLRTPLNQQFEMKDRDILWKFPWP